jgi:hypothetical protein
MYWQSLWLELCGRNGRRAFASFAPVGSTIGEPAIALPVLYFSNCLVSGRFDIKLLVLFPDFRGAVDDLVDLQSGEMTCLLSVADRIS